MPRRRAMRGTGSPDRERVARLLDEALALPAGTRAAFLEASCAGDGALRAELESLLAAHEASAGFFERLGERVLLPAMATVVTGADGAEVEADLEPGQTVGHYEVLARHGGGGMGVVYKARDVRLDRLVALKFLPRRLADDGPARARLVAEAKAASALDHPNIAVVYEIEETDTGHPFIAMAWYPGESLAERLGHGPLPVRDALGLARQVAGALGAVHRAGIIHQDVKPANILVTREGAARLVDFGIAKVAGAAGPSGAYGTIAYMSPEQTRGRPVDPRTDVWSLGVVLYEMLAGQRPFHGEDERGLVLAIRHQEPDPVVRLRPEVPAAVAALVATCLAKDAEARFPGMENVLARLDLFHAHSPGALSAAEWAPVYGDLGGASPSQGT